MNCELIQTNLKAYCDRELPLLRRLAIHHHLASCAACRNEVKTMEKISKTLQSSESAEPLSNDLRTRILTEAAKQGKPTPSTEGRRGKLRLSPALVGVVCTVFALTALFVMHPWGMESRTLSMGARDMVASQQAVSSPASPQMEAHFAPQAGSKGYGGAYAQQYGVTRSDSYDSKWANSRTVRPQNDKPDTLSSGQTAVDASGSAGYDKVVVHTASSAGSISSESLNASTTNTFNDSETNGHGKAASGNPTIVAQVPAGGVYYATPPAAQAAPDSAKNMVAGAAPVTMDGSTTNAPATMDKVERANGSNANGNLQALDSTLTDISLNRQVHREATITVQLKDPEAASDQVNQMIKEAGGYVASNNLTTDGSGSKSAQMILKVPVAQFDTILGQIEKMGNVTDKNVTGEDITNKVSDASQAESVLEDEANKAAARLQSLGRHAKWSDVEDAREVRIELAQSRARVQLLHKLAALSDISLSLTETPKPTPPAQSGFLNNLKGDSSDAFQSLISTVGALLTLVIWALAYAPIWGPIAFAVWYGVRRKREHSQMSGV